MSKFICEKCGYKKDLTSLMIYRKKGKIIEADMSGYSMLYKETMNSDLKGL